MIPVSAAAAGMKAVSLEQDVSLLGSLSFFEGFKREQLRLLAFGAESRRYEDGDCIHEKGTPCAAADILVSGEIVLTVESAAGRRRAIKVYPGDMLGEIGLLAPATWPSTAIAIGSVEILRIGRPLFRRILKEYPEVGQTIKEQMVERLKVTVDSLQDIRDRL